MNVVRGSRNWKRLWSRRKRSRPIFVSTMTTVICVPADVFLTGIAKLLFIPLTITIGVALFGSFFVSRTVTPLMCLKYLPPEKLLDRSSAKLSDRIRVWAHDALEALDARYAALLQRALQHRKFIILSISGAAVVSLVLVKFIGTEFFPDQDEGQFTITVKLPVGTRNEETIKVVQTLEHILQQNIPELQAVISDIGVPSARSMRQPFRPEYGQPCRLYPGGPRSRE